MKYPCDKCSHLEKCSKENKTRNCIKWEYWFRAKWNEIKQDGTKSKRRKWIEDDEIKMWELWNDCYYPAQIAKAMGRTEQQIRSHLDKNVILKRACKGTVCQCPNEKCEWKRKIDGVIDYCPLNHCIKGER